MDKNTIGFVFDFFLNDCVHFVVVLEFVCKRWKQSNKYYDPNVLLCWAAEYNYPNICIFSKRLGATDYERMFTTACQNNHINICRLAKMWFDFDEIIISQITEEEVHKYVCHFPYPEGWVETKLRGHAKLCRYKYRNQWGKSLFEKILFYSAYKGYENFCKYAKEMGADNFQAMLQNAAKGNQEHICRLAKEWGANNFDDMLIQAVRKENESLCCLAKDWGASLFTDMLSEALFLKNKRLCELAIEWGAIIRHLNASDYNMLLDLFDCTTSFLNQ